MLGKILSQLRKDGKKKKGEITAPARDINGEFREEMAEELETVEQHFSGLRSGIEDAMEELDEYLEGLEGYEDYKSRSVMEDVVDNVAKDRKKMIQDFSVEKDPGTLHDVLEEFVEEFETLSQKEAAVMDEANLLKELSSELGKLKKQEESLQSFLEGRHQVKKSLEELESLVEKRGELGDELEELEQELENIDTRELEEEVDRVEEELHELKNSGDWEEYQELEEELEQKKSEIKSMESRLKKQMSKMERGLKKLLYQASKTSFGRDNLKLLEKVRDGKLDQVIDRDAGEVEEAADAVLDADRPEDVGDSAWSKMIEGAEKLADFSSYREKREGLEEKIGQLEENVQNHKVLEREEELEREKKQLERQLEDEREREKELEQKIQDTEEDTEQNREKIVSVLERHFSEVKLED